MESMFKIGDVVKIAGVDDCIYGVDQAMRKYVGKYVRIVDVRWQQSSEAFRYEIEEDCGEWWWSDDCFEREQCFDLPEFCVARSDELGSLLSYTEVLYDL